MDVIAKSIKVAVCIATYKRPIGLQRLLSSLRELKFIKSKTPDWSVVVVENDSLMPNKTLVDILRRDFPVPLIYGVESTRGIASTRNRAVQLSGNVDFIAIIDDDEVVESGWLDELLIVQQSFSADVVTGPVFSKFEQSAPSWILKGRFFKHPRYPTGTIKKCSATNNVLVKANWISMVKGPFDERCNFTGGEDALFFTQIYLLGAKIVWADEAIVTEYIPTTRVSAHWLFQRAFRRGITTSSIEIIVGSSFLKISSIEIRVGSLFLVLMIRALKGAIHIIMGVLSALPALVFGGYAGFIQGMMFIGQGMGELGGLLGFRYQEYKRIHGN